MKITEESRGVVDASKRKAAEGESIGAHEAAHGQADPLHVDRIRILQ